jgi:hypothetical protein
VLRKIPSAVFLLANRQQNHNRPPRVFILIIRTAGVKYFKFLIIYSKVRYLCLLQKTLRIVKISLQLKSFIYCVLIIKKLFKMK